MTLEEFLEENPCFKFLKWVEVIQQENLAVKLDAMYILEKDKTWCDVVFVDSNGNKRKVGGTSLEELKEHFAFLDLSNLSPANKLLWKQELGGLDGESASISIGTVTGLNPDQNPTVTNSGTAQDAIFNFGIPKGPKGDPGDITVVSFNVDENMHLIMETDTPDLFNFSINENGHLILD